MRLTDFKVLTFDCYGTLIDWESGILNALAVLVKRAGKADLGRNRLLELVADVPAYAATVLGESADAVVGRVVKARNAITHWSPSRTALVLADATSLPLSGSL